MPAMGLPEGLAYRAGQFTMGGVPAERLARAVGTPVYAYCVRAVERRFARFAAAFRGRNTLLCYALKANPTRGVARILAREGAGCDVVSGGELARALASGFPAGRIVFSGVGKTAAELAQGLRAGIRAFHVESAAELGQLEAAARRARRPAPFAVRVNPDVKAGGHAHIVTGLAETKFGVEAPQALALYRRARRSRWLSAVGIQSHIGSQIVSPAPYRRALKALLGMVDRLAEEGSALQYLDIGGGMGIGYDGGPGLDPEALARAVLPALGRRRLQLVMEPGRWLVGPAGVLLTRVLYLKATSRRRFVIVDAGMNDLLRPALYGARHRIVPVRPRRGEKTVVDVVGPVCETADTLALGVRLPPLRPGDLLAVLDAGAYGSSMGSQYNSRPRPPELLVDAGRVLVARLRETYADLVRHER